METIHLPVIIGREGKWYGVACPVLDVATQGQTEEEAIENMKDLIKEYFEDPDMPKPDLSTLSFPALSFVSVKINKRKPYGKIKTPAAAKSYSHFA